MVLYKRKGLVKSQSFLFDVSDMNVGKMRMYKEQRNYENVNRMNFEGVGQYDIPPIKPIEFTDAKFIGFNFAKTTVGR